LHSTNEEPAKYEAVRMTHCQQNSAISGAYPPHEAQEHAYASEIVKTTPIRDVPRRFDGSGATLQNRADEQIKAPC